MPLDDEARKRGGKASGAKRAAVCQELTEKRQLAGKVAALAQKQRGLTIGQPIEPPDNILQVIETLGQLQVATYARAAQALRVSEHTFGSWVRIYPEIQEAWAAAKLQEHDAMVDKLVRMALGKLDEEEEPGNIVALLFSLKARHGYRDQGEGSRVGTMNNTQIVINIPGAKSREEYTRALTAPTTDAEVIE